MEINTYDVIGMFYDVIGQKTKNPPYFFDKADQKPFYFILRFVDF